MCHKSWGHVKTCNENAFPKPWACAVTCSRRQRPFNLSARLFATGARELCTSVNGSDDVSHAHFFSWFLNVASHEVGKRELAVPVTLGDHWPPGRQLAKVPVI